MSDVTNENDPYIAAATAVMDAVALTPLHGLCRDGRPVTLDDVGVPAGVSIGWTLDARERIAEAIRRGLVLSPGLAVAALVSAAVRYRDAARAFGGPNRPGADYAALLRERDAASGAILRWTDRHAPGRPGVGRTGTETGGE